MPPCPGPPVRTASVMKSARVPLVIHIFAPLITYSSPLRRAVVRRLATSLPASGSEMPSAAIFSPASAGTRNSFFCSGVPIRSMIGVAICDCTSSAMLTPEFWHRINSSASTTTNQ